MMKIEAKEIHLSVYGAKVNGNIVHGCDPAYLDSDMLQVVLDNGIVIDIGWVPDGDPAGAYRIVAYRDHFLNKVAKTTFHKDPFAARDAVVKIASFLRLRRKPGSSQDFKRKSLGLPCAPKINREKRRGGKGATVKITLFPERQIIKSRRLLPAN